MDFKVMREAVAINETVYEGSMEQPVDCDITLPDYCPDILRVLKCQMIPRIGGYQVAGDRLTVDGSALIRLMYASEKCGAVHCYEFVSPFSKSIELKNVPDNPSVRVKTSVEYVNCRAISQRRTDVHGAFSLHVKICARKNEELLIDAQGTGVQLRRKNVCVSSLAGDVQRQFTVNEILEVGSSKPVVQHIIRCSGTALLQDYKIITNKLLIKGELLIKTLYACDIENTNLETIEHSIPISQIIDIDGVGEDCGCDIRLQLMSLDLQPKNDAYGESRLLDVTARINASVFATKSVDMPVITDAYSLQYEMNMESRPATLEKLMEVFQESTLCRKTIDIGSGIASVFDVWCTDVNCHATQEGKEILINGNATVCVLCKDSEGQASYLERKVDFDYKKEMRPPHDRMKCDPTAYVIASDYSLSGDDKIEVRLDIKIEAAVFAVEAGSFISSMDPDEKRPKNPTTAALTIYFAEPGESVWNIARKYNTTVNAVTEENDLRDDRIADKQMILIPGV